MNNKPSNPMKTFFIVVLVIGLLGIFSSLVENNVGQTVYTIIVLGIFYFVYKHLGEIHNDEDATIEKYKSKIILYLFLIPVLAQALYYYGLKKTKPEISKYANNKGWLIFIPALLIQVFLSSFLFTLFNLSAISTESSDTFRNNLVLEITDMNKDLPQYVDEETRLDNVQIEGNTIVYKYTLVNYSNYELSDSSIDSMYTLVKDNLCSSEDFRPALNQGYTANFTYLDKDGVKWKSFTVSKSDCN